MSVSEKDVRSYFTPYKYGKPILEPSGEEGAFDQLMVDNMRICRHNGKFYCSELIYDIYLNQLDIELYKPKTVGAYLILGTDKLPYIEKWSATKLYL